MGRDISKCHPKLQELAAKLIEEGKKKGFIIKLGECFRTVDEQNILYAQGRTTPGSIVTYAKGDSYSSMHQWGVAFDVIRNDGKGAYNDSDGWFGKVGALGKSLGLEWGGDWTSPVDKPHFQLKDWGSTPQKLKSLYGNVNNFIKTWQSCKNEEDNEMVTEGTFNVNGKNYKAERILKDGKNYISIAAMANMGFNVSYDANTKIPAIENKINDIAAVVNGKEKTLKGVNIAGYNYCSLRSLAEGEENITIDYIDGKAVFNTN